MSDNQSNEQSNYEVVRIKRESVQVNEREAARLRLQQSVDNLTQEVSLHANMQKEPLKLLGVATGVGSVMGLLIGRSFSTTKKVYVNPELSKKDQKAFEKAQMLQKRNNTDIGGALVATLGTLAFKVLQERVLSPKLDEVAQNLMNKAADRESGKGKPVPASDRGASPAHNNLSSIANGLLHPEQGGEVTGVIVRDFRPAVQRAQVDKYGNEIYGSKLHRPVAPASAGSNKELVSTAPTVVIEEGQPVELGKH